ncbi:thioredoxin domain-containing protein [Candidatus Saccharibacteria bacterium]|nr:thioredoxin domain-containing protein [Candidatus Saccharibacteria bacterium]
MKKLARILGIIAVASVLIFAIISSMVKTPNVEKVWDPATTVGNLDAKNYFIVYSDIMCPYCVAFENAIFENEENFENYIETNDILVEIRLSDYLYEFGESHPISSRYSALGTYCAKNEGKFWDYYRIAITTVWNDYFKNNVKPSSSELNPNHKEYWIKLGEKVELGEKFANCVENDETLDEIITNTRKTANLASGMPFFKFNRFTSSGFDTKNSYEDVLMFFQAGLES